MCKKDRCRYVRLVYDARELLGVTTVRLEVVRVLQLVLKPTLTVLQTCMSQLRRIHCTV
jgi:hypothetical protein